MLTTTNMSLTVWNDLDDEYDHTQLAANWEAIDAHDHSASMGVQIPTGGLADHSVTHVKLAANAVTTAEILDQTILGGDIADGVIGLNHFASGVLDNITPLGIVSAWYRPLGAISVPTGYVICDGSVVTDHSYGGGAITVPDLRNKFVLGSALSGTGSGPNNAPVENAIGGNNSRTFTHTHTVGGHSHTVNSHSHTVNSHSHTVDLHNHTVDSHSHLIGLDGSHNHSMHSRLNAFLQGLLFSDKAGNDRNNSLQSLYVAGFNNNTTDDVVPSSGAHSHGGATGASSASTSSASPGTSNASPGTDSQTPGTSSISLTTDLSLVGGDVRPNYVGLLYIVKVKH